MQPLITTHDFFSLSSFLNYQLSGLPVNWRAVMTLMHTGGFEGVAEQLIIETLMYLGEAYGQEKRKLGPFAVLHPIRTASLLSRASSTVSTLDVLTTLLHDKAEDITENKYSRDDWQKIESMYQGLIRKIDSVQNWYLNERIHFLTKSRDESYQEYLDFLITQARLTPELVRVKLADRLDNTLDLRMDIYEDTSANDCYRVIFEALFSDSYDGLPARTPHHTERKINGASRLYELYKNAILMSMLRSRGFVLDETAKRLFRSLAAASSNEAQNILLHIFTYHLKDPQRQRALLLEVMDYHKNVAETSGEHRLEGFFREYFSLEQKERLTEKLDELYRDKDLMAESAVSFIVIFTDLLRSGS